jgi:MYXO-CTERM domain-containing protein
VKRATSLAIISTIVLVTSAASATPPATLRQLYETPGRPAEAPTWVVEDLTVTQATAQIAKIAAWDVTMQATDCIDPDAGIDASQTLCDAGGVIEVESGPGHAIVESDNTQQAIGIWSYNQQLNAVAHLTNITGAFQYLATHPGYLEWRDTGDSGPDYYSVYNCGWGLRAVLEYEKATGDRSHHEYGVLCANHIATYAPALVDSGATLLDTGPAAWAASGLWAWADATGNSSMKTAAAGIGAQVKAWIEAAPTRLSSQQWAMTGGAPFFGVVESYMKENPSELTAWVTKYAPLLGGWIDESTPADPNDWTDWRNALAAWNMLAHFTSAQVLGTTAGNADALIAKDILTKLVAQAGPTSGAIPGSQQRPSTEAESWITAYMVYFGLLEVIAEPKAQDAGPEGGSKDASGPPHDASGGPHDASRDATQSGDAGSTETSDTGCSCGMAGETSGNGVAVGAFAALFLVAARRKQRVIRKH